MIAPAGLPSQSLHGDPHASLPSSPLHPQPPSRRPPQAPLLCGRKRQAAKGLGFPLVEEAWASKPQQSKGARLLAEAPATLPPRTAQACDSDG